MLRYISFLKIPRIQDIPFSEHFDSEISADLQNVHSLKILRSSIFKNFFTETSRNSAKKRKVPSIDEISQHIDYAHVKRSNFDRGIQPKDIYEMLMQTDDSDE